MSLKLSIAQKFAGLCGMALLFLLMVGAAGYQTASHLADSADHLLTDAAAIKSQLQADMAHDALRGDVLAALLAGADGEPARRQEVEADLKEHIAQFGTSLERLEKLPLEPAAKRAVAEVRPALDDYVKEATALVELAFTDRQAANARLEAFKKSFRKVETEMSALSELLASRSERSRAEMQESDAQSRAARWGILATLAVAAVLLLLVSWLTSRHIVGKIRSAVQIARTVAEGDLRTRIEVDGHDETAQLLSALAMMNGNLSHLVGKVREASESIATGTSQIAMGNQDLSQRTEEQASNLQQTAASMEEISASVRTSADATRAAGALAGTATSSVGASEAAVNQLVSTMGAITDASRRITDITALIDSIAFQTNILALNAAVEAARAGDQGRGFAVVAGEVRTLAQRSGAAAKEIKALIDETVQKVAMGEQHAAHAGGAIQEVTRNVRSMAEIILDISRTNEEQSKGISEVSQAVAGIDQVTQRNASLVEEAAAAAESLREQATGLVQAVATFRVGEAGGRALART